MDIKTQLFGSSKGTCFLSFPAWPPSQSLPGNSHPRPGLAWPCLASQIQNLQLKLCGPKTRDKGKHWIASWHVFIIYLRGLTGCPISWLHKLYTNRSIQMNNYFVLKKKNQIIIKNGRKPHADRGVPTLSRPTHWGPDDKRCVCAFSKTGNIVFTAL